MKTEARRPMLRQTYLDEDRQRRCDAVYVLSHLAAEIVEVALHRRVLELSCVDVSMHIWRQLMV